MKKIAAGLASIVFALSLTACSGDAEDEVASLSDTSVSDAEFSALVRENTDDFDAASDAQIAEAGAAVCGIWDAGGTLYDVIDAVIGSGVDPKDGGFLAGAGTAAYCPEYNDRISDGMV